MGGPRGFSPQSRSPLNNSAALNLAFLLLSSEFPLGKWLAGPEWTLIKVCQAGRGLCLTRAMKTSSSFISNSPSCLFEVFLFLSFKSFFFFLFPSHCLKMWARLKSTFTSVRFQIDQLMFGKWVKEIMLCWDKDHVWPKFQLNWILVPNYNSLNNWTWAQEGWRRRQWRTGNSNGNPATLDWGPVAAWAQ